MQRSSSPLKAQPSQGMTSWLASPTCPTSSSGVIASATSSASRPLAAPNTPLTSLGTPYFSCPCCPLENRCSLLVCKGTATFCGFPAAVPPCHLLLLLIAEALSISLPSNLLFCWLAFSPDAVLLRSHCALWCITLGSMHQRKEDGYLTVCSRHWASGMWAAAACMLATHAVAMFGRGRQPMLHMHLASQNFMRLC